MTRLPAALAMVLLTASIAGANDCAAIADDRQRLACFDAAHKVRVPAAPVEPTTDNRARYADTLRRGMLSRGFSTDVWAWEQRPKDLRGADHLKLYPRLYFWGYLTEAMVFQIMTQGAVLQGARQRGFTAVEFDSKSGRRWQFDVRGDDPRPCDKIARLCL